MLNYNDIGKKIKGLAKVEFIAGAIISVLISLGWFVSSIAEELHGVFILVIGLGIIVLGVFVAWVSSWLLYGFGELVDKLYDIERNMRGSEGKSKAQSKIDSERMKKAERLRSQGLITEEEYQNVILKEKQGEE